MDFDDRRPAQRVVVTIDGQEWELVPTEKLTMPEVRLAKQVSGGMGLAALERGLAEADPDAWFAWLYVSIRRSWPKLATADLERAIGEMPIVALIQSVEKKAHEVADPDPPALLQSSAAVAETSDGNSGETIPAASTSENSGSQD